MNNFDTRIITNKGRTYALIATPHVVSDDVIAEEMLRMGFACHDIGGEWHAKTLMWNFYCSVEPIIDVVIGAYRIKKLGADEYSVTDTRVNRQKILHSADFDTLFSIVFI